VVQSLGKKGENVSDRIEIGNVELVVGDEYIRRELHDKLGGPRQQGISSSAKYPVVLLFSGPGGEEHGYGYDGWKSSGVYEYTGEGRLALGDQRFARGNKAIRDHEQNGKSLLLFQQVIGGKRRTNRVRFEGEMRYTDHRIERRDSNDYGRDVIVFVLSPAD
jgi:5-methylcytosine-specific restriction enzyme A